MSVWNSRGATIAFWGPHVRHILKVDYTFQIQAYLFDANKVGNLNHVNVVSLTITPFGTIPPPS